MRTCASAKTAHDGKVVTIAVDSDQDLVISGGKDGHVVAYRISDGEKAATFALRGAAVSMQYAAGVRTAFVGDSTGRIHIQKIVNKNSFKAIAVLEGHGRTCFVPAPWSRVSVAQSACCCPPTLVSVRRWRHVPTSTGGQSGPASSPHCSMPLPEEGAVPGLSH